MDFGAETNMSTDTANVRLKLCTFRLTNLQKKYISSPLNVIYLKKIKLTCISMSASMILKTEIQKKMTIILLVGKIMEREESTYGISRVLKLWIV